MNIIAGESDSRIEALNQILETITKYDTRYTLTEKEYKDKDAALRKLAVYQPKGLIQALDDISSDLFTAETNLYSAKCVSNTAPRDTYPSVILEIKNLDGRTNLYIKNSLGEPIVPLLFDYKALNFKIDYSKKTSTKYSSKYTEIKAMLNKIYYTRFFPKVHNKTESDLVELLTKEYKFEVFLGVGVSKYKPSSADDDTPMAVTVYDSKSGYVLFAYNHYTKDTILIPDSKVALNNATVLINLNKNKEFMRLLKKLAAESSSWHDIPALIAFDEAYKVTVNKLIQQATTLPDFINLLVAQEPEVSKEELKGRHSWIPTDAERDYELTQVYHKVLDEPAQHNFSKLLYNIIM